MGLEGRARVSGEVPHLESPGETGFVGCSVCFAAAQAVVAFLSRYQHELVTSSTAREDFSALGGFCAMHWWQYDALAGPRGVDILLADALDDIAKRLRIDHAVCAAGDRCYACDVRMEAERTSVEMAVRGDARNERFCLRHLRQIVVAVHDTAIALSLVLAHAEAYAALASDMRHFVLKTDALRTASITPGERASDQRGLAAIAGSRGINGLARSR